MDINIDKLLFDYNSTLKNQIDAINDNRPFPIISVEFNASELLPFTADKPEKGCKIWAELWAKFEKTTNPVVYLFDVLSEHKTQEVYNIIDTAKNEIPSRTFPSTRINNKESESKTLYVGSCAKTLICQRLFWHTGYYKVGGTQGLQLCHWTRSFTNLMLRVNVLILPYEAQELTAMYEHQIARKMNPIIGKH